MRVMVVPSEIQWWDAEERHPRWGPAPDREGEKVGNAEAQVMVELCLLLAKHGAHFSIENPETGYLFRSTPLLQLSRSVKIYAVGFDQCAYGLQVPPYSPNHFCKKATTVWASFFEILELGRRCPGRSNHHHHVVVQGSVRYEGQTVKISKAAGAYPPALCSVWAQSVRRMVDRSAAPILLA